MQHELPALRKLADARPETDKVPPRDGQTQAHGRLRHIEYPVLVQPEAVRLVRALDEVDDVFALCAVYVSAQLSMRCSAHACKRAMGMVDARCSSRAW
jgi:hypothetical protein